MTAALSYFTMASGGGWSYYLECVQYHHKEVTLIFRQIYWARYIDWSITTPLILIELTVLAGLPGAEILLVVFADIAMILFVRFPSPQLSNVRHYLLHLHIAEFIGDIMLFLVCSIYTLYLSLFFLLVVLPSQGMQELENYSHRLVYTSLLFGHYIQLYGRSAKELKRFLWILKSSFSQLCVQFMIVANSSLIFWPREYSVCGFWLLI